MKRNTFPLFKTKMPGVKRGFRLEDPVERKEYFQAKAGAEIALLRAYVAQHTFVGFLLGKKNSGKGTYSKLFMEAVGASNVAHVSVGDIVFFGKFSGIQAGDKFMVLKEEDILGVIES